MLVVVGRENASLVFKKFLHEIMRAYVRSFLLM